MITNSAADYYKLNNMPEDVLKEIALQESGPFDKNDLKTATYYQKCTDFSKRITLEEDVIAMLNATSSYANTIKRLACVDKQLHQTLTDLKNQLNPIAEENALLKLHYFDQFKIVLPFHDYEYIIENNERMCNAIGKIQYYNEDNPFIGLSITCQFYYNVNEHQKLALPEAMQSLKNNHSLENATYLLQKLSEEGFNNSKPNTQKYLIALNYFNTILEKSTGSYGPTIKRSEMSSDFELYALPSETDQKSQLIPYLLIKKMFTNVEKS